jgi:hypothetical protein
MLNWDKKSTFENLQAFDQIAVAAKKNILNRNSVESFSQKFYGLEVIFKVREKRPNCYDVHVFLNL